MAKGYWIVSAHVDDAEAYKTYVQLATEATAAYGARYVVRGGRSEVVEGTGRSRNVVVEFPSYDVALECFHSPAYQNAREKRLGAADFNLVIIEGFEG